MLSKCANSFKFWIIILTLYLLFKFNSMKSTIFTVLVGVYVTSLILSCSTTKSPTQVKKEKGPEVVDTGYEQKLAKDSNQSNFMVNPNEDAPSNISLGDMIRRLPGVQVSGRGTYLKIKVSGAESFMANTDPLFVVNGTAVGTNYAQVANTVNPNDISSISVLKGADATIYGARGANGVILIRTKKTR